MKIKSIMQLFALIVLSFLSSRQTILYSQENLQHLLEQRVSSIEIIKDDPQRALAILANEYKIPIAVEFPSNMPRKDSTPVPCLELENVSIKEVLNGIINCNPDYWWSSEDRFVKVASNAAATPKDILDVFIDHIEVKDQRSAQIRKTIAELPEIRAKLQETGYEIHYLPVLGAGEANQPFISFSLSKVTLREVLNYLIQNTHLKYWSVSRVNTKAKIISLSLW